MSASVLMGIIIFLMAMLFIRKRREESRLEVLVRQRTKELEIQSAVAKVASQSKSDFLARMSHEIRTPLNAIVGMTAIAKKSAESEKTAASLNEIVTASNHLLGIINDILDMSKIESGKFVIAQEPFNLQDAIKEVVELIEPRCAEKQIRFIFDYEKLPDTGVLGDKLRLKQVIINLLGNAVKFTPQNGEIDLLLTVNAETSEEITITFGVKDNGIGMTESQLAKLFTPFEQADKTIAARFGGTGLGLAISQNLVSQMGGVITVQSAEHQGSLFTFTLALRKTGRVLTNIHEEGFAPDLSGKRILLVEDIEINRMILTELLEDTHVQIDEALDGVEAVDRFSGSEEKYYDLILMDIQMPNMDGYEAAKKIRGLPRNDAQTVSIIAMTANAYREDIENALKAGMNGHIAKPIDVNLLMRVLIEKLFV
jgi:signal transduction histidine kinase/ActR/RegA family two-component response regulator